MYAAVGVVSGTGDGVVGVLILAKITRSSAGGYAEYLEGKAQAPELGEYYLRDGDRVAANATNHTAGSRGPE